MPPSACHASQEEKSQTEILAMTSHANPTISTQDTLILLVQPGQDWTRVGH